MASAGFYQVRSAQKGPRTHRNDAGRNDGRNYLFIDFAKIAAFLRPDAVIVESVPELLTTKYWP